MQAKHWKTLAWTAGVGLLVGGILGLGLGSLIPDYYLGVFGLPETRRSDAPTIGLGLGLSQGFIFGSLLGIVLVIVDHFRSSPSQTGPPTQLASPAISRALVVSIIANFILTLLIVCGFIGYGLLKLVANTGRTPDTTWVGQEVFIHNISQETLIVTHLAVGYGPRGHVGAYAVFDPPLLLTRKERPKIDPVVMRWHDPNGQPAEPPEPGTPVTALFIVPDQAVFAGEPKWAPIKVPCIGGDSSSLR